MSCLTLRLRGAALFAAFLSKRLLGDMPDCAITQAYPSLAVIPEVVWINKSVPFSLVPFSLSNPQGLGMAVL